MPNEPAEAETVEVETTEAAAAVEDDAAAAGEGGADDAQTLAGGSEAKADVAPSWPEDWRDKLAGGDEKALNKLKRMQSPADVWKSYRAMEQRLGDAKPTLPDEPTEEQVAEYRKANGIPDTAEGYLDNLDGIVVGDDDKPIVEGFLAKMHAQNAPPALVQEALGWYYAEQEERMAALVQEDKAFRGEAEEALRAEWGNEYRANINAFGAFLDTAPEGLKDALLGARGGDGKLLGDNPAFLKWVVGLANEVNPAGTITPGAGLNQIDSVEAEIAKINRLMVEKPDSYYRDEKMQARYRQLLDAQDKLKSRAA